MNTAATAWLCGTPALVSPAIRPASTTPAPPGTGTAPPISPAAVITTNSVARLARSPTAGRRPRRLPAGRRSAADDAPEAQVTGGCVDRLALPGGGPVTQAVAGRTQVRAALDDLARQ